MHAPTSSTWSYGPGLFSYSKSPHLIVSPRGRDYILDTFPSTRPIISIILLPIVVQVFKLLGDKVKRQYESLAGLRNYPLQSPERVLAGKM